MTWAQFWREAADDWKADVQPALDDVVAEFRAYFQERRRQRSRLKIRAALKAWPLIDKLDAVTVRGICSIVTSEARGSVLRRSKRETTK